MWRWLPVVFGFMLPASQGAEPEVTRVARVIVAESNRARDDAGAQRVVPDVKLVRAAQAFADFMAKTDRFDHRADGSTPAERARKAGYTWCYIAENIAWESRSVGFESDELAQTLVKDWLESPGHRRNLLDPNMHDIGVGIAHSSRTGRWYAVQMLGRGCHVDSRLRGNDKPHISTLTIALPMPVSAAPEMSPAQRDS